MKLVRTRSTASSSVDGRPIDFRLQMQPVSWNCKYHFRTYLPLGGSVPNVVRNAVECSRQTCLHANQEQNDLCSPLVVIFLSCLLVDESGTNTGKINFESLPSKAHISQQDTLIRFRIINYWNREHLFDLACIKRENVITCCVTIAITHLRGRWWISMEQWWNCV
jgi:hypothetical protein